jgi:Na+/H+ antiporter NhaD/arsenite permease-like protein
MSEWQIYLTVGIIAAVVVAIAFDWIDMAVATLLGVVVMILTGILDNDDFLKVQGTAGGVVALLFGGMVVARVLETSGVFASLGPPFLRLTQGSGRRFLLLIVPSVAIVCAFLPNAATVVLIAPLIIRAAQALGIGYVGPMILVAIVSNAAGLLTLVGDPATYMVGAAIGMSFADYLRKVSLGGLLAVLVIVPLLPLLMRDVWKMRRELPPAAPTPPLQRPAFVALAMAVLTIMVLLFLFGEKLPVDVGPPSAAILGATLALLAVQGLHVEPVSDTLRAVDWKTLIFLGAIMSLMQALEKTGLIQGMSLRMSDWLGTEYTLVALTLLAAVGLMSTVLANIPVVAASIVMTKGYFVAVEAVPEIALSGQFTEWPAAAIPVFVAMMFGGTLGGNATLIGASANVVAAGICAQQGERVTFARFARYGVPITLAQLAVATLYVLALVWWL